MRGWIDVSLNCVCVCVGADGLAAVDPTSDWNAPTELWGNYEEPAVETPAPAAAPVSQQVRPA